MVEALLPGGVRPFIRTDDPYLAFALAKTRGRLAVRGQSGVIVIYRLEAARWATIGGKSCKVTDARWVLIGRADEKLHHDDCGPAILAAVLQVTQCPLGGLVATGQVKS